MIKRRRSREQALQILYFMRVASVEAHDAKALFKDHFEVKQADADYMLALIYGVEDHRTDIEDILDKALLNWKLYRLAKIDRCILQMSMFELLFDQKLSAAIVINEAVELGKKFGDEKSAGFINGVLDRVAKDHSCQ